MDHSLSAALDQGIEGGVRYAHANLADRPRLGRIARAHTPKEVLTNLGKSFGEPTSVRDSVAYWSGFAHDVQRVVRETADDSPSSWARRGRCHDIVTQAMPGLRRPASVTSRGTREKGQWLRASSCQS